MTIVTLYALFGGDIFILCKPPDSSEIVINILDFITFVVFALEFLLQCAARKKYIFSFYFFLDAFATISLITTAFTVFDRTNALSTFADSSTVQSGSSFRAGRAARAAARAARIVRVSKLLILQKKNANKKNDVSAPSVIGGMLSDRLSIKIVSIICSMLIVTIFISFIEVPERGLTDVWAISGPEILDILNGYFQSHPLTLSCAHTFAGITTLAQTTTPQFLFPCSANSCMTSSNWMWLRRAFSRMIL
jgi:hypothetical protein